MIAQKQKSKKHRRKKKTISINTTKAKGATSLLEFLMAKNK